MRDCRTRWKWPPPVVLALQILPDLFKGFLFWFLMLLLFLLLTEFWPWLILWKTSQKAGRQWGLIAIPDPLNNNNSSDNNKNNNNNNNNNKNNNNNNLSLLYPLTEVMAQPNDRIKGKIHELEFLYGDSWIYWQPTFVTSSHGPLKHGKYDQQLTNSLKCFNVSQAHIKKSDNILSSLFLFTSKGCSWQPIPAHPWYTADCKAIGLAVFTTLRAFNQYAWPCISIFRLIWITLYIIRSLAFKGCSWQLIPAYPRSADWYNDGAIKSTSSSVFDWYAELYIIRGRKVKKLLTLFNSF